MRHHSNKTSLWTLVETMQHALEQQGFAAEAVDAAVTQKIASIIDRLSASKLWSNALAAARKRAPRDVELSTALQLGFPSYVPAVASGGTDG